MAKRRKNKRLKKASKMSQPAQAVVKPDQFEVVVLATMSAGKSTIINALIGTELLPSSNQACTARVFKIENHDGMNGFKATVVNKKTGQPSSWVNACPETLQKLNDSGEEGTILIHGDIKSIYNQGLSLAIYDTPGPNNSQDESHGQITKDILSDGNFGLVLYALNATQFGVEDDAKLLQNLFDLVGDDLDHKEVVFVLNKADQLDEGLGEDLDAVVEKVEVYLERHGFKMPRIIPLSSIAALLARKVQHNESLTSKEKRTYRDLIGHAEDVEKPLYEHANLSGFIKEKLKAAFLMGRIRRGTEGQELLEETVANWMDDNMITGGLRRYFHMVSASMMVCPFIERTSVGEMLINMQKVLLGGISVMYPKGGWQPLIDLFSEKIKENGEIRLKTTVTKLEVSKGKIKGVYAGDEFIPAKKVVLSLPSLSLPGLLPENTSSTYIDKCKNNRPTAGIVIDYCLKKKISDINGLCYLYNPMSFGMFTSNLEPSLAPEGKQILTWLQPVPESKIKDSPWAKKRAEELEKALFALFPTLKDNIEWKRVLYLPVVDGTEVNINQIESKRPSAVVPGLKGLFLVGDSIAAPGAGGDVGHESVHVTYEKIKEAKE